MVPNNCTVRQREKMMIANNKSIIQLLLIYTAIRFKQFQKNKFSANEITVYERHNAQRTVVVVVVEDERENATPP